MLAPQVAALYAEKHNALEISLAARNTPCQQPASYERQWRSNGSLPILGHVRRDRTRRSGLI